MKCSLEKRFIFYGYIRFKISGFLLSPHQPPLPPSLPPPQTVRACLRGDGCVFSFYDWAIKETHSHKSITGSPLWWRPNRQIRGISRKILRPILFPAAATSSSTKCPERGKSKIEKEREREREREKRREMERGIEKRSGAWTTFSKVYGAKYAFISSRLDYCNALIWFHFMNSQMNFKSLRFYALIPVWGSMLLVQSEILVLVKSIVHFYSSSAFVFWFVWYK